MTMRELVSQLDRPRRPTKPAAKMWWRPASERVHPHAAAPGGHAPVAVRRGAAAIHKIQGLVAGQRGRAQPQGLAGRLGGAGRPHGSSAPAATLPWQAAAAAARTYGKQRQLTTVLVLNPLEEVDGHLSSERLDESGVGTHPGICPQHAAFLWPQRQGRVVSSR